MFKRYRGYGFTSSSFSSRANVLVFMILFGAIGGYIIVNSFAATPTCTVSASPTTDSVALQTTLRSVNAGGVLCLHAGTYGAQGHRFQIDMNGTTGSRITIQSYPGEAKPTLLGMYDVPGTYITLDNLHFSGPTGSIDPCSPSTNACNAQGEEDKLWLHGNGDWLTNSEVDGGLWRSGVFLSSGTDMRIINNWIHDNGDFNNVIGLGDGANADHGIYMGSGSAIICSNLLEHNQAEGVVLYNSGSSGPHDTLICNNTTVNNGSSGIQVNGNALRTSIIDNIVAYNGEYGIYSHYMSDNSNTASNNIVYGNGLANDFNYGSSFSVQFTSERIVNPLFISPKTGATRATVAGGGNYHLQAASPAINNSSPSTYFTTDIEGTTRPQSTAYDIGAYEYKAGQTYYVSKNGNNSDGKSWATAWNELNQINWGLLQPGDKIIIDGGATACNSNYDFSNHLTGRPGVSCGMLYTTPLNVQKSGTSLAPIIITLSTESGRNGTAVVFGGRSSALPYCTQNYTPTGTARGAGITIGAYNNIIIDGGKRSGVMVYGAQKGVDLNSDNTAYITLRNMEIFDNGTFTTFSGGGYHTDQKGISLNGSNITIDRTLIHDNGQDEIQDEDLGTNGAAMHMPLHDITINNSWLYNHRESPVWPGYPFNSGAEGNASTDCTHVDGVQIFGGGTSQKNFTVSGSVFGPLLAQGFYPGDQDNASFDNVQISNSLFINALLHNIEGDPIGANTNATPGGWKISNVTSYLTNGVNAGTVSHGFGVWGLNHGLSNSIFYNGYFANTASFSGANSSNIYFGGDPIPGGTNTIPSFTGPLPSNNSPGYAALVAANFTPNCANCSGKGSSIHKVQDLLDSIDTLNGGNTSSPKQGDLNNDGVVNIFDLSILLSHYGQTTSTGDLNSDSVVNIFDLSILLSKYGT